MSELFTADRESFAERVARVQRAPGYRRYVWRGGKMIETTPKKGDKGPKMSYGLWTSFKEKPKRLPLQIPPGTPESVIRLATGP
jgi:hypothetical protein